MMGQRRLDQGALFYEFCLERHVPEDHLLRVIYRFVDLEGVRAHLVSFYSPIGRPSIDPELLIRMLPVVIGVHRSLDVVPHHPASAAASGHRARIGIAERELAIRSGSTKWPRRF